MECPPETKIAMRFSLIPVWLLFLACAITASAADVRVLVVYYSESGNTETLAKALAEGAAGVEGCEVIVRTFDKVSKEELTAADGIAIGSPVHIGDVPWPVRQAIIRWAMEFGLWESRGLQNKAAAVFVTGGLPSNGKEFTLMSLSGSLLQLGAVLVSPYGSLGASATTSRPDPGVDDAEKEIASLLGERLATIALRLKRGAK